MTAATIITLTTARETALKAPVREVLDAHATPDGHLALRNASWAGLVAYIGQLANDLAKQLLDGDLDVLRQELATQFMASVVKVFNLYVIDAVDVIDDRQDDANADEDPTSEDYDGPDGAYIEADAAYDALRDVAMGVA